MLKSIVLGVALLVGVPAFAFATHGHERVRVVERVVDDHCVAPQRVVERVVDDYVPRERIVVRERVVDDHYAVRQNVRNVEKVQVQRVRQQRLRNAVKALTTPRQVEKVIVREQVRNHY